MTLTAIALPAVMLEALAMTDHVDYGKLLVFASTVAALGLLYRTALSDPGIADLATPFVPLAPPPPAACVENPRTSTRF